MGLYLNYKEEEINTSKALRFCVQNPFNHSSGIMVVVTKIVRSSARVCVMCVKTNAMRQWVAYSFAHVVAIVFPDVAYIVISIVGRQFS